MRAIRESPLRRRILVSSFVILSEAKDLRRAGLYRVRGLRSLGSLRSLGMTPGVGGFLSPAATVFRSALAPFRKGGSAAGSGGSTVWKFFDPSGAARHLPFSSFVILSEAKDLRRAGLYRVRGLRSLGSLRSLGMTPGVGGFLSPAATVFRSALAPFRKGGSAAGSGGSTVWKFFDPSGAARHLPFSKGRWRAGHTHKGHRRPSPTKRVPVCSCMGGAATSPPAWKRTLPCGKEEGTYGQGELPQKVCGFPRRCARRGKDCVARFPRVALARNDGIFLRQERAAWAVCSFRGSFGNRGSGME